MNGPAVATEIEGHAPPEDATAVDGERVVRALLDRADSHVPFGPSFFLGPLGGFVRDRCPDPAAGLPQVSLYLLGGETLELCHVIGLSPRFIVLAVWDGDDMRTEIVPYETIARVAVRSARDRESRVGFNQDRAPMVSSSPEQMLRAAARTAGEPSDEAGAAGRRHA